MSLRCKRMNFFYIRDLVHHESSKTDDQYRVLFKDSLRANTSKMAGTTELQYTGIQNDVVRKQNFIESILH